MKTKTIPTPEQRPELYDGFDDAPREMDKDKAYYDAVLPDHLKAALADKKPKAAE